MAKLTEEMVQARTRQSNLSAIIKLNFWGSELQDVSLVRRLPNVETLSLSVNKIRTLADFQNCRKLKNLYVRKNDIKELKQICYLRDLPLLTNLWLAENPCAETPGYRWTVLKTLPRLEKLDDVVVTDEDRTNAQRFGYSLTHPEQEDTPSDTDEQFAEHSPRDYRIPFRGDGFNYSPRNSSPVYRCRCIQQQVHDEFMMLDDDSLFSGPGNLHAQASGYRGNNSVNNYSLEEPIQNNGYNAAVPYDHNEEDYRAQQMYIPPPPPTLPLYPQGNVQLVQEMHDDYSPPRSVRQDEDHEDLHPRASLPRNRTGTMPRLIRPDLEDGENIQPRISLPRSRTEGHVDALGSHHAGSLNSLHERDRYRSRLNEMYPPRPMQQPSSRPRNTNVMNAILFLLKELDRQELELVKRNVILRMDELRI